MCFVKQVFNSFAPIVGKSKPTAMTVPTAHTLPVNAIHMPRTLKIDYERPKPLRGIVVFHRDRHALDFLVSYRSFPHPKNEQDMNLLLGEYHATPISAE